MRASDFTQVFALMRPFPLEGRAGMGVVRVVTDGPPPPTPPLKGEGSERPVFEKHEGQTKRARLSPDPFTTYETEAA